MNLSEKEALIRQNSYTMTDLLAIMAELRSETGCPWDRAQTHASIRRCLLEEAYEVADAIDKSDPRSLSEELGDLLFQIVFHAQIEQEAGNFSFAEVVDGISKKMIERHPHVFAHPGDEAPDWNAMKSNKRGQTKLSQRLEEIPEALPALMRADKLLDRMAQAGSSLDDYRSEERAVLDRPQVTDQAAAGEMLLAFVADCRSAGIDCERALADACDRLTKQVKEAELSADPRILPVHK